MAEFRLTLSPRYPAPPQDPAQVLMWAKALYDTLIIRDREIVARIEALVLVDAFANRPAADGTYRFYFANDTNALYFDDGTWNAV